MSEEINNFTKQADGNAAEHFQELMLLQKALVKLGLSEPETMQELAGGISENSSSADRRQHRRLCV